MEQINLQCSPYIVINLITILGNKHDLNICDLLNIDLTDYSYIILGEWRP